MLALRLAATTRSTRRLRLNRITSPGNRQLEKESRDPVPTVLSLLSAIPLRG